MIRHCKICGKIIEYTDLDLANNVMPKPDMMASSVTQESKEKGLCKRCFEYGFAKPV